MAKPSFRTLAIGGSALVLSLVGFSVSSAAAATGGQAHALPAKAHALPHTVPASPPPLPSIGKAEPEKWPKVEATVNSLTRSSGGLITLVWTVRNTDTAPFSLGANFNGLYTTYQGQSANGITLTDEAGKVQYSTLRLESGRCLCTSLSQSVSSLNQNEEATMFAEYKLPESVTSVTVGIPGFSPVKDVNISS